MNWARLLTSAGVSESRLQAADATANTALLNHLMHGSVNGTGIAKAAKVYIHLAINLINRDCWIVNRELSRRPFRTMRTVPREASMTTALPFGGR